MIRSKKILHSVGSHVFLVFKSTFARIVLIAETTGYSNEARPIQARNVVGTLAGANSVLRRFQIF